jgi:hypothetical protein
VRTNDAKVGHSDFFRIAFLNQRQNIHFVGISRVLFCDSGQPEMIDQVNQFQMPWQEFFQKIHAPFLKSLRQNSVIGV